MQEQLQGGRLSAVHVWVKRLLWMVTLYWFWGRPVLFTDPDLVWPLGQWLSAPHAAKLAGKSTL